MNRVISPNLKCSCLAASAAVALLVALAASPARAQTAMPANWQQLPADQFATAAEELFAGNPSADHAREVVQHAWQMFLNSEAFVTTGDWDAVEQLMNLFVGRRGLRVTGNTFAEREGAQQQADADLATLESRVSTRLGGDPELVRSSSFAELQTLDSALAVSGVTKAERAAHFAAWMAANDWQSLSLADQGVLLGALDADRIDRSNMSVRWTGFITAPRTDDYTFSQLAHYQHDAIMKVWVKEQQVLNSTPQPGATPEQLKQRFTGQPVQLTAGQRIPIRIEFSHRAERAAMIDNAAYPMAVLLWESSNIKQQIVPAAALSPPEGVPGQAGLAGEYFSGSSFDQPVTTRVDGPIDFIWPGLDDFWAWRQVVPVHEAEWNAVFAAASAKLTDANYLASLSGAELQQMLLAGGRHILGSARASQRLQILHALLAQPEKLAALEPFLMGRIVKHTYMLPGDGLVQLIGTWADRREQPRTQLGSMFGWGEGTYQGHNLEYYWHMGHFFTEPYWPHLEKLLDERLREADGDCNLTIAYIAAWATSAETFSPMLVERLEEALADESLAASQRMTWLLAQLYAQNVMTGGEPEPLQGLELLQEATLATPDRDRRFWALQEMVARLGSWDAGGEAKELIEQFQETFDGPGERAAMAEWQTEIDRLAQTYAATRPEREQAQRVRQQQEHIAAFRKRLAEAEARGDSAAAAQYRQLISAFSSESLVD